MRRSFKATLALAMTLALAACSTLTEPASDDTTDAAAFPSIEKQVIDEPEEGSGGTTQPSTEVPQEEDASNGRGRGNNRN